MKKSILEKGKLPPQALELEDAVLGALMIDKKSIIEIDFLDYSMFYKESNKLIFKAITDLYVESNNIDILTVGNQLRKDGNLDLIGGDWHLIQLTQKLSSSAHIETHARIIVQKFIQRNLIDISSELTNDAYDETSDVLDLLDSAYTKLNSVTEQTIRKQETEFKDVISSVLDRGIKIYNGDIKAGISTPIRQLTDKSGGWRDTELIIMAARPGMGKTAFALKCAREAISNNIPTAFFSLEMSTEQLTARLLSMEYRIDNHKFNISGLDITDQSIISDGYKELSKLPLYIDDTASLTIEQFKIKAKRLKSKHDIGLIVLDYLQLMGSSNSKGNREQEISKISRGLKMIAKELKIPVIALSQLSRAVESRGGSKRPMLSDLRESGAIEQDADMVMFFYRPEYYGITEWDDYDNVQTVNEAEYIVAKNRNGALVRNRMRFEGKYTLFSDLEDDNTWDDNEFQELKTVDTDLAF